MFMPQWVQFVMLLSVLSIPAIATNHPACLSPEEAHKQVGKKQCVSGKVLAVNQSPNGMTFLDFCRDFHTCSFAAVVFPADAEYVGDVSDLVGRNVEIRGKIKESDGRVEMVLQDADQIHGNFARLPPTPSEFDVEKQGKFSAGTFHAAKPRKASRKRSAPAQGNVDVGNPDSPE